MNNQANLNTLLDRGYQLHSGQYIYDSNGNRYQWFPTLIGFYKSFDSSIPSIQKSFDSLNPNDWFLYPPFDINKIVGFKIIKEIPFFILRYKYYIHNGVISSGELDENFTYSIEDCLKFPEFFEPIFDEK